MNLSHSSKFHPCVGGPLDHCSCFLKVSVLTHVERGSTSGTPPCVAFTMQMVPPNIPFSFPTSIFVYTLDMCEGLRIRSALQFLHGNFKPHSASCFHLNADFQRIASQVGLRKASLQTKLVEVMNSSWAISNPKRWCCESAALNMPANLENLAVATGLEKVSFHSNPKERQCQRMLKLPHNCTHLTH